VTAPPIAIPGPVVAVVVALLPNIVCGIRVCGVRADNVAAAEIPGQTATLVALTFTLRNTADKILYVHNIQGKINTASGEFSSEAVSAVDFERYFQAFPALKNGAQPALSPEAKLQPGEGVTRTVVVAFPVNLDAFNQRHSVSVIVEPYDQPLAITLTK